MHLWSSGLLAYNFLFLFLVETVGFSVYSIMSSANNDSFTSSFPIWIPYNFSCLIAVARTSTTTLNKSGKSRHTCLGPDLKGKHL